jgi:methyl-accepting chemotaxis protein
MGIAMAATTEPRPSAAPGVQPGARTPAQPTILQSMGGKARNLNIQARSMQTTVGKSGWNSALQANNVNKLRTAVAGLQQDLSVFQTNNRAANIQDAVRVSNDLQQRLNQVTQSLNNLSNVHDANGAVGALTQISASLDGIIRTIETLPPCCTEGICCHVGFK